jgi:imidazole glycerol-phosphate synthase subunit HisH
VQLFHPREPADEALTKMQSIIIVDYGMGNLRSVQKALEKVGHAAVVSSDPTRIAEADKIIVPGVGAFCDAMARLRETGMAVALVEHIRAGKPFLGICLGLQLLFSKSFEDGEISGLDLFKGEVVRFPDRPGLKVPHMGWNHAHIRRRPSIFEGIADDTAFYFVHSYYVAPADPGVIATETDYPTPFTSMIWQDNVFATQFHPEKSQRAGLQILHNFAALR